MFGGRCVTTNLVVSTLTLTPPPPPPHHPLHILPPNQSCNTGGTSTTRETQCSYEIKTQSAASTLSIRPTSAQHRILCLSQEPRVCYNGPRARPRGQRFCAHRSRYEGGPQCLDHEERPRQVSVLNSNRIAFLAHLRFLCLHSDLLLQAVANGQPQGARCRR